jgi:hypothetical protein
LTPSFGTCFTTDASVAVDQTGSDLRIEVEISYLAELLAPGGKSLFLFLHDCRQFAHVDWDSGKSTVEPGDFESLELEILGTDSITPPYGIGTTTGDLTVDFSGHSLALGDGTPVQLQQLQGAAKQYWDQFDDQSRG